jgi:hypothetical protein
VPATDERPRLLVQTPKLILAGGERLLVAERARAVAIVVSIRDSVARMARASRRNSSLVIVILLLGGPDQAQRLTSADRLLLLGLA